MMRELTGLVGVGSILGALMFISAGCTPTDRNFASGGAGGTGGAGGQGGGGCPAGFTECDGNPETVCETDTATSLDNCGTCGKVCAEALDAEFACVAGMCSITSCTNGRDNCDNFYDNGCETNTNTNSDHCGKCGNSCEAPDAITGCVAGACQIANCVMGKLDCDMNAQTGCESDPTKDVDNCGGCGMACPSPNAQVTCQNSACVITSCDMGFGDCNVEPQDGCEIDFKSDPLHCGSCPVSCKNGGCRNGTCVEPTLVAKTNFSPGELAIFKDELFFGSRTAGDVGRVSVLGGNPTLVGSTMVGAINSMQVNGANIVIAGAAGSARMDWAGANQFSFGTAVSRGIDFDSNTAYWTTTSGLNGLIRGAPITGGIASTFVSVIGTLYSVVIQGGDLYWTQGDGSVWTSPTAMISPKQIVDGPNTADNLAVDGMNVYWSSSMGIHSAPIGGGAIMDLAPASSTVRALAIDGTHVYWTDDSAGLIQRVPKDGSSKPDVIAFNQAKPWGIVVSASTIYWASSGSNEIYKVPK